MARPPEGHNLTRLCQGQIANDMYNSLPGPSNSKSNHGLQAALAILQPAFNACRTAAWLTPN